MDELETSTTRTQESESEQIRRAFGMVVTRHRLKANFKQRMFARVIGISNSHLRSIESGGVSPTLATICKIASALNADPSDLVREAYTLAREAPQNNTEFEA